MCQYMLFGIKPSVKLTNIPIWDDLYEVLKEEHSRQIKNPSGKTRRRNLIYFIFKMGYYNKMRSLTREESGAYVRAICEYMFSGKEPHDLPSQAGRYYMVTKLPLEVLHKRKEAGAKDRKISGNNKQVSATKAKAATKQLKSSETRQDILPAQIRENKTTQENITIIVSNCLH